MQQTVVVSKFGGTSMASINAMTKSALISAERKSFVIVVSATSGTTDQLIRIAQLASAGDRATVQKLTVELREKHLSMLGEIEHRPEVDEIMASYFTELSLLIQNIILLKELTPKAHDHVLSIGERISSVIFKEVLSQKLAHKTVRLLDARTIMKTDSNYGKATPLLAQIEEACQRLNPDHVYVTQGFIGADLDGNTTVLGRGGSDYSAALIAEGLNAKCLEIWTDVAGIATTDPRICSAAQIIPEMSYAEAAEMAQYGAKILHPATIAPAVRKSIPVFVGSTFDQHAAGTWIKPEVSHRPAIRALTKRSHQVLLTITNPNMWNAYGFMGTIFDVFGRHRISVDCVTTSEIAIAVTVDQETLAQSDFMRDLERVGKVEVEAGYALVSVIGNDLFNRVNLAQSIFTSIKEHSIRMMSLGASPYNFNFLVKEEDAHASIQKLHRAMIENG